MLKDLSNLYKRIVDKLSEEENKDSILHIPSTEISDKLAEVFQEKGTEAIALIQWQSARLIGYKHQKNFNIIPASKAISLMIEEEVLRLEALLPNSFIQDISIIMDSHTHLIYLFKDYPHFCLYFVFNSQTSNLAKAKNTIATLANTFSHTQRLALENLEKEA